jgi:uncharacterized protein (DUF2336 family)
MDSNNKSDSFELTDDDIQKLIKSPFEKKIDITKKIADYYQGGGFTDKQMMAAAKIFSTLVKDTEVKIRKTLSEAIKDNPLIPREVILSLANDVNDVSLPVLQFSDVLTDEDLIEIVNSSEDAEKQVSISRRKVISEGVTEALIDTENADVVDTLLHNSGANLSEEGLGQIVEKFSDKEEIMMAMIERETLPVNIVESLASKISESLYASLQMKHQDAFLSMGEVVKKSRDVATMKVIGLRSTDSEYYGFCQLMDKLRIPTELAPIYALCMGNMNIFEVKIARLTQTPVINIRQLIKDSSNKGFRVLYKRAGLPDDLVEASEVLVIALRNLEEEFGDGRKSLSIARLISSNLSREIIKIVQNTDDVKNLDYIMSLVNHYASGVLDDYTTGA